jgi:hypothetical protein
MAYSQIINLSSELIRYFYYNRLFIDSSFLLIVIGVRTNVVFIVDTHVTVALYQLNYLGGPRLVYMQFPDADLTPITHLGSES